MRQRKRLPPQRAEALADPQGAVERETAAAGEHERGADREERQRRLDAAQRREDPDCARLDTVHGVGELYDERRDEHRSGEEDRIETREQPGDEKRGADDLGPGGDVTEERRDAVDGVHVGSEGRGAARTGDLRPAVRNEDQPCRDAQEQQGGVGGHAVHRTSLATVGEKAVAIERLIASLILFVFFYVATLLALAWTGAAIGQSGALLAVVVATTATVGVVERWRWNLGLLIRPDIALRELLLGSAGGAALIGLCALLVTFTTDLRHLPGEGFPWIELVVVFVPAALHEELLFRGYVFQKLHQWNRAGAIGFVSAVFAVVHWGNANASGLGLMNIFLGGVLLSLAYERYCRLWFPIGIHLAWNLMTGPVLGHEVSGYESLRTVFVETGSGPVWLTGGEFGIEGSIWMTLVEMAAIAVLVRTGKGAATAETARASATET